MTVDLSDLMDYSPQYSRRVGADYLEKVKPQKPEGPRTRTVALAVFWTRYTCDCGAEYEAPTAGYYPAYRKVYHEKDKSYTYEPLLPHHTIQGDLERQVSLREERIRTCPWCLPSIDSAPDFDPEGVIHCDPFPGHDSDEDGVVPTGDAGNDVDPYDDPPRNEISLDELLDEEQQQEDD